MVNTGLRRVHRSQLLVRAMLAVLLAISVAGCAVRTIGDYDEVIDRGVSDVQQRMEMRFARLQSDPMAAYDQSFYIEVDSRLAVLKTRAASLPRYPIIVEQLTNLRSQVDDFQKLDNASSRPFPVLVVTSAESAISVSVESILTLELAMKRGAPQLGR